jgi:hypothetical protein
MIKQRRLLFGISQEAFMRGSVTALMALMGFAVKFLGCIASDVADLKTEFAVQTAVARDDRNRIAKLEAAVFHVEGEADSR